jgi:hypothetical protein
MATVAEIQERLQLYRNAEKKILEGNQSWEVSGNKFTRAELPSISRMITSLEMQLAQAQQGGELSYSNAEFPGRR